MCVLGTSRHPAGVGSVAPWAKINSTLNISALVNMVIHFTPITLLGLVNTPQKYFLCKHMEFYYLNYPIILNNSSTPSLYTLLPHHNSFTIPSSLIISLIHP